MKLTSTLLIVLGFLSLASVAQAAVITTVEWESKPGAPWSYTSGRPNIDCTMPVSPAGGCALRFEYPTGTYSSSFGGGRSQFDFAPQSDVYIGAWMRYSPNFVWHPVGHKVNFWLFNNPQQCSGLGGPFQSTNVAIGYGYEQLGAAPQVCWNGAPLSQVFYQNIATWEETNHRGEWHWYEMRVKINTPGVADGITTVWIDDVLYLHHTNARMRNVGENGLIVGMQHTAEYGGGGSTVAADMYWWVDHTVISTTRIGRPGNAGASTDSVAPAAPRGFIFQ